MGELVAIDRMLSLGLSSDMCCLSLDDIAKAAHGKLPCRFSPLPSNEIEKKTNGMRDLCINGFEDSELCKYGYGWGSGLVYRPDIFKSCDMYVTCEPCVMCSAAIAKVGISRVFFGCRNDRFGGCGSLLSLHEPSALPSKQHQGYEIHGGILETEAISLL